MKRILFILIILAGFSFINPAAALVVPPKNLKIISYNYPTHFMPGELVDFTVIFKNYEPNAQWGEVDIVLTNHSTGAEVTGYPIDSAMPAAGATATLTNFQQQIPLPAHKWSATEGLYTVTLLLYDGNGNLVHRIFGAEPIHVGQATDYISAFPGVIDLGAVPYGRYMYPNPIKINWSFYLKNQLRKDQPWYMRIYTDNGAKYRGVEGSLYRTRKLYTTSRKWVRTSAEGGSGGLVSTDGQYLLPLKVWCLNYGPDWDEIGWNPTLLGPPPVTDDYVWKGPLLNDGKRDTDRSAWAWIPDYADMGIDPRSWRRLIGQDPYTKEFVTDNNPTGDFTLPSPFDIYLATETSPATVKGRYMGKLILEIYTP